MEFIGPRETPFVPLKSRGELPHLYKPGCCYFVTFRLADAVVTRSRRTATGEVYEDIDPRDVLRDYEPPITLGSCVLSRKDVATMTQDTIRHFDDDHYHLVSWCIMPNHVHVILAPLPGHRLDEILRSWKGFTARGVNRLLGRTGPFWERESFDHVIRTAEAVERFAAYVENNPVEAGLCATPAGWPFSSAGSGFVSPLGDRQIVVQASKPAR